jgi:hypothetical protein
MHLSIGETAVLRVEANKIAKLIFNDDKEYFVEGIFSKLRLSNFIILKICFTRPLIFMLLI